MNYDWDCFGGYQWSNVLLNHPEQAIHCDWDKLDGDDWSWLLREQPQFAEHCDWDKLDGWDWCRLILDQPEFLPFCIWDKFDSYEWKRVSRRPDIMNVIPYNVQKQAVMVSACAIHSIKDPDEQLRKLHKIRHEL